MIECEFPPPREYPFYAVLSLTNVTFPVSAFYGTVAQFGQDEAF